MAGELQQGGFIAQLTGVALVALSFIPGLQFLFPIGQAFLVSGTALGVAGSFITPYETRSRSDDEDRSASYGFDQFDNPVERDAAIPVVYSLDGVPVAAPYAIAFSTPAGRILDEDFVSSKSRRGQALSALFPLAPHRVGPISDIRVDDIPLFEEVEGFEAGTGTSSKREFVLGKRIVKETVRVQVGGTEIRETVARQTVFLLRAGLYLYTIDLPAASDDVFADEEPVDLEWAPVQGTAPTWRRVDRASADPTGTFLRPIVWPESKKRLRIHTQGWEPATLTSVLRVTYRVRQWSATYPGVQFGKTDGDAMTIVFANAAKPAVGAKVTADFWTRNVPGVTVDLRHGTESDLPLDGFGAIRQTIGDGRALDKDSPLEFDTEQPVDDVLVDVGSAADFRKYDNDGTTDPVTARVRIHFKKQKPDGTYPSSWTALPHPLGESKDPANPHDATSFNLSDDSPTRVFWTFSLRGVLGKHADRSGDSSLLDGFTRARYRVKVTRINGVAQDNEETWRDAIVLVSHTEVRDVFLALPGFAKGSIHGLNAKRTGGRLPRVRFTTSGNPDVPKLVDVGGGVLAWDAGAPENQSNAVWAACDFFVEHYGGGRVFDRERNIDKASALAAATHAGRSVSLGSGDTEVASRLDVTIDTRSALLDHLGQMLEPAGVIPFLQGDLLKFAIDAAVDLATVPVVYDGTEHTGGTYDDSQGAERGSISLVISEVEAVFYDEDADWKRETAWSSPEGPATERRVKRLELRGVTRRSQAQRFADDLRRQAENEGRDLGMRGTSALLGLECGDVFLFRSTRIAVDTYFRVRSISVGTAWVVDILAREYVPAAYGQETPRRAALKNSTGVTTDAPAAPTALKVRNVRAKAQFVRSRSR